MNHNKYITIQIQDLSTSELIHSIASFDEYESGDGLFGMSDNPICYCVKSDDMAGLLASKEIMSNIMENIYEVLVEDRKSTTIAADGYEEYGLRKVPGYMDSLKYYNLMLNPDSDTLKILKAAIRKLHSNRFQLIEGFSNKKPAPIQLFDDEDY